MKCTLNNTPTLLHTYNFNYETLSLITYYAGSLYKSTSKITDDKIESQYLISNASQEDSGTYTCKVITLLDEAEKIVSSVKVYQATRISTEPSSLEVVEGSRLTLDCDLTVSSQLAESLEVFWLKDDERLVVRR